MPKNVHFGTIVLISHPSKVTLKILPASLQQYVNHEFPEEVMCKLKSEKQARVIPLKDEKEKESWRQKQQQFTHTVLSIAQEMSDNNSVAETVCILWRVKFQREMKAESFNRVLIMCQALF